MTAERRDPERERDPGDYEQQECEDVDGSSHGSVSLHAFAGVRQTRHGAPRTTSSQQASRRYVARENSSASNDGVSGSATQKEEGGAEREHEAEPDEGTNGRLRKRSARSCVRKPATHRDFARDRDQRDSERNCQDLREGRPLSGTHAPCEGDQDERSEDTEASDGNGERWERRARSKLGSCCVSVVRGSSPWLTPRERKYTPRHRTHHGSDDVELERAERVGAQQPDAQGGSQEESDADVATCASLAGGNHGARNGASERHEGDRSSDGRCPGCEGWRGDRDRPSERTARDPLEDARLEAKIRRSARVERRQHSRVLRCGGGAGAGTSARRRAGRARCGRLGRARFDVAAHFVAYCSTSLRKVSTPWPVPPFGWMPQLL